MAAQCDLCGHAEHETFVCLDDSEMNYDDFTGRMCACQGNDQAKDKEKGKTAK